LEPWFISSSEDQTHVQSVKLLDGDFFDLSTPFQEIAFSWLRVHPTIASSRNVVIILQTHSFMLQMKK
jgi:hypothetical protein